ncbi:MAG: ATP-binding protein [Acetobacteraceae bacterium]
MLPREVPDLMDELRALLSSLGLERYLAAFTEAEIDLATLQLLSENDLKELGLSLGARRRLLAAIAAGLTAPPAPAGTAPASPPHEPAAERRPLTVLFCDLVGSTALAHDLDPEDMGRIVRRFQDSAAGAVARFEGFVERFTGDGMLIFFGYPRAQENAAERAVRSGFAIIEATRVIMTPAGPPLAVRVAIASGDAFIGEALVHGGAHEPLAAGEVLNLAARLQEIAPANGIAVSAGTHALLRGLFELEDLGLHPLKGIGAAVPAWRVLRERAVATRFEAAGTRLLSPLVGREAEGALLTGRWAAASQGEGQVVLLSAEAGLGKSRLIQELRERAVRDLHVVVRYQCSPMHTNSALHPVIGQLRFAAGVSPEDPPERALERLAALLGQAGGGGDTALPLIAALLAVPGPHMAMLDGLSAEQIKNRTLEVLIAQMLGLAHSRPLMVLVEDAHWMDPTTQELISLAIDAIQNTPVLIVITYRPAFQHHWGGLPHATTLRLGRLTRTETRTLIGHVAGGKELPNELTEQIIARTDGVPLFVEELTKAVLALGSLVKQDGRYVLKGSLAGLTVPATLRDSLLARVEGFAAAKEVAQLGAVLGREFRRAHIAAMAAIGEATLDEGVARLLQEELIHQHGSRTMLSYVFKHALVQEAAYSTLVQARRRQLHARCAEILKELSPEIAEQQPEVLAQHYHAAGQALAASEYWLAAGRLAARQSAHQEAISHLRAGLAAVAETEPSERREELELKLELELGVPLIATQGYAAAETEAAWDRARALAERRNDGARLAQALYGLWAAQVSLGRVRRALDTAGQVIAISERIGEAGIGLVGGRIRGLTHFMLGDLAAARADLERTIAGFDPGRDGGLAFRFGQNPRVSARAVLATVLALQTECSAAREAGRLALEEATEIRHTNSEAYALAYGACMAAWMLGDIDETAALAERLVKLAREHNMGLWGAYGASFQGWALAKTARTSEALALFEVSLKGFQKAQAGIYEPLHRGLAAVVLARSGRREEGLARLEAALAEARRREELWSVPELIRLKAAVGPVEAMESTLVEAAASATTYRLPLWEKTARAALGALAHGAAA